MDLFRLYDKYSKELRCSNIYGKYGIRSNYRTVRLGFSKYDSTY